MEGLTLGIQVSYNTGTDETPIHRLALVVQVIDADAGTVALSVYSNNGMLFLNSVEKGDGPGQWNFN